MKIIQSIICSVALLLSSAGHALTLAPYSSQAFAAAQAAGQPVALHFHADWCPTCRAQDKALESLKSDSSLNMTVLSVDYDNETALKSKLKVRTQSTFIVYRGDAEKARQSGETSADGIRALLRTAL
jgi:thiol-disulfide isomerase/thioredoxin